eukprot:SAG25_NODE_9893_length_353_cov_1.267717_1_plen_46_part_10
MPVQVFDAFDFDKNGTLNAGEWKQFQLVLGRAEAVGKQAGGIDGYQ